MGLSVGSSNQGVAWMKSFFFQLDCNKITLSATEEGKNSASMNFQLLPFTLSDHVPLLAVCKTTKIFRTLGRNFN